MGGQSVHHRFDNVDCWLAHAEVTWDVRCILKVRFFFFFFCPFGSLPRMLSWYGITSKGEGGSNMTYALCGHDSGWMPDKMESISNMWWQLHLMDIWKERNSHIFRDTVHIVDKCLSDIYPDYNLWTCILSNGVDIRGQDYHKAKERSFHQLPLTGTISATVNEGGQTCRRILFVTSDLLTFLQGSRLVWVALALIEIWLEFN